jgi:hypothetical protein
LITKVSFVNGFLTKASHSLCLSVGRGRVLQVQKEGIFSLIKEGLQDQWDVKGADKLPGLEMVE